MWTGEDEKLQTGVYSTQRDRENIHIDVSYRFKTGTYKRQPSDF